MSRLHPSRWPLAVWLLLSIGAWYLRLDYTLGSLSLAPAVALLSGTWLGARRAAFVQALAVAAFAVMAISTPGSVHPGEWGFRAGLIVSAAIAGVIARPDGNGAHPPRFIRFIVLGAGLGTVALVLFVVPREASAELSRVFLLTFLLGSAIAVFYAYKMVPEPGRVVGYAFCLLPYYVGGVVWSLILQATAPVAAYAAGMPEGWRATMLHAYLAHLPGELISLVLIGYIVCAIDREGATDSPMAIGRSR